MQHEQIREANIKLQKYTNGEIVNIIDTIDQELNGYGKEYTINRNYDIGDAILTIKPNDELYIKVTRNGQVINSSTYTIKTSDVK